jgi:hypothetical protein
MTLFAIHLQPLPDELCSSWLIRLAAGQGLSLRNFQRLVMPRIRISNDADLTLGEHQVQTIAVSTGIHPEAVRQTLLRCDPVFGQAGLWLERWIIPIGEEDSENRTVGYQYCPACLDNGEPYFRKSWRYALFTLCTDHGCMLVDTCARCGEPIHAYRSGLAGMGALVVAPNGISLLSRCRKCGWDLRKTSQEPSPGELLHQQIQHQQAILAWRRKESDPLAYFLLLRESCATFAREIANAPYVIATPKERVQVLMRAGWLLNEGRWRYIQSICDIPRSLQPILV